MKIRRFPYAQEDTTPIISMITIPEVHCSKQNTNKIDDTQLECLQVNTKSCGAQKMPLKTKLIFKQSF